MQILLASAKMMNDSAPKRNVPLHQPQFAAEAAQNAGLMCGCTQAELQSLFACSAKVAAETYERYRRFFTADAEQAAVLAYCGQAYRGLRADLWTDDDLRHADSRLWITSFLYGLLRPLDAIRPYRMEGGIRPDGTQTMFDFWKPLLTSLLIRAIRQDDGVLVHLATAEMERLFHWQEVRRAVRIVQPQFLVDDGRRLRNVAVHSKTCRGAMTRYIVQQRIDTPDALPGFSHGDFRYAPEHSTEDAPCFIMRQG